MNDDQALDQFMKYVQGSQEISSILKTIEQFILLYTPLIQSEDEIEVGSNKAFTLDGKNYKIQINLTKGESNGEEKTKETP